MSALLGLGVGLLSSKDKFSMIGNKNTGRIKDSDDVNLESERKKSLSSNMLGDLNWQYDATVLNTVSMVLWLTGHC